MSGRCGLGGLWGRRQLIRRSFVANRSEELMRHGGNFVKGVQSKEMISINSKPMWTTGAVDHTLEIGPWKCNHRFHVLDGLFHDVVLGCDFLRPTRAIIDFSNQCLTIQDTSNITYRRYVAQCRRRARIMCRLGKTRCQHRKPPTRSTQV